MPRWKCQNKVWNFRKQQGSSVKKEGTSPYVWYISFDSWTVKKRWNLHKKYIHLQIMNIFFHDQNRVGWSKSKKPKFWTFFLLKSNIWISQYQANINHYSIWQLNMYENVLFCQSMILFGIVWFAERFVTTKSLFTKC